MKTLEPNGAQTIEVDPRPHFHPSGIEVTPGARYRFAASGKWKDSWYKCGPDGWNGLFLQAWNRLPWHPFFLLCGAVGENLEHDFAIGADLDWTAPPELANLTDRQLYFFANDWPSKYGNNHPVPDDPLKVTVTRIG
jgi:hypothetical protein